jgi:DNA-binding CsgD family transcriptional regulator
VIDWLQQQSALAAQGREPRALTIANGAKELMFSLQERTGDDDWLIVMREVSDAAAVDAVLQAFKLTLREAEVLYWVAKGKTNRDIGDILGSSPATVKKHLEHVFEKLGVETRNAAASLAIQKVRALAPWHGG